MNPQKIINFLLRKNFLIFLLFLILPFIFFAININFLQTFIAPGDGAIQGVPTKIFSSQLNLWNPFIQTGTFPFKDIGWQSLYVPGIIIIKLFPNPFGYNLLLFLHYSMAGYFTFLFLRKLQLHEFAALIGGISFMFSGFLTAHKGHHTMLMAATYLPVILYFIERYFSSKQLGSLILASLAFSLSIFADYTAVSMYIGMVAFPYIIFRVLTENEGNKNSTGNKLFSIIKISITVFVVGLFLAAVQIIPIIESLKYITREKISFEFFSSFSFPFKLIPILLFPYIYGTHTPNLYSTQYFGSWNLTEMAGYMGILPVIFSVLTIVFIRNKFNQIYFWSAVSLIGFILVLGDSTPLYHLMYNIPIYNMFRASARNWLEVNFSIAILSSFFIHFVLTNNGLIKKRYFQVISLLFAVFVALVGFILIFVKDLFDNLDTRMMWIENSQLTSSAIFIPLIIMLLSFILLILLFQYKNRLIFKIVLTTVIFFDLFSFGHFHDYSYPEFKFFKGDFIDIVEFFNDYDPELNDFRIYPLNLDDFENQLYPNVNILYGFNSVNGYNPIWIKDFSNLTSFQTSGMTGKKLQLLGNSRILSQLSTKYIITKDQNDKYYLQNFHINTVPGESITIADSFENNKWVNFSPFSINGESAILKTDSENVSLIQYPFVIQPSSNYLIKFKARLLEEDFSDDPLIVDFIGDLYDSPEQESWFDSNSLTNEFQEFSVKFNSGNTVPPTAFLRFFTFSDKPYEIKDVHFSQISGGVLYWGSNEIVGENSQLYDLVYETNEGVAIFENLNFLPRARFVENIINADNTNFVINQLWFSEINPSTSAFVEGFSGITKFDDGQIISAEFSKTDKITISVKTGERSFLVLSDSWYPGWRAYVDGKETKIYKTNATSRGIVIENPGEHIVEYKFIPLSFYLGLIISAITLILVGIILNLNIIRRYFIVIRTLLTNGNFQKLILYYKTNLQFHSQKLICELKTELPPPILNPIHYRHCFYRNWRLNQIKSARFFPEQVPTLFIKKIY